MKPLLIICVLLFSRQLNAQERDSTNQNSRDTVGIFHKVEVDASFPGGKNAWTKYLQLNLDANAPLEDLPRKTKTFTQTAICQFIVCKDGTVCEIKVINDVLPSIKKEVERVIAKSGNWVPAEVNGKKVKSYKAQPITFFVSVE